MFQFQNCAAPTTGDGEGTVTEGTGPGFIDDLANQKLAFVESLIVTKHDKRTVNFDGLCDRDSHGKVVSWVIEDASNRDIILEGSSECIQGGFRITADQMNSLDCNTDYDLVAAVGEFHDDVIVRKKCQPMSTVEDQVKESNTGYAKQCFFELENGVSQNDSICYRSCYSSAKLYSRTQTHPSKCLSN